MLHKLHGTRPEAGRRKGGPLPQRREPQLCGDLKKPPADLTPAQREEWTYMIESCPPGMLKKPDRDMLIGWVKTIVRLNEAERNQADLPLVIDNRRSPHLVEIEREMNMMIKLSDRLGFSPSARPRIQVEPEKSVDDSPQHEGLAILRRFPSVIDGGKKS